MNPPIVYILCWVLGVVAILLWSGLLAMPLWSHSCHRPIKANIFDWIRGAKLKMDWSEK